MIEPLLPSVTFLSTLQLGTCRQQRATCVLRNSWAVHQGRLRLGAATRDLRRSITCEFRCIGSLYVARIGCCLIRWCTGQRCSCADRTAPLSEFSLLSRRQNLRTVRVSHSFCKKIARISRRVEQILSRGTRITGAIILVASLEARVRPKGKPMY